MNPQKRIIIVGRDGSDANTAWYCFRLILSGLSSATREGGEKEGCEAIRQSLYADTSADTVEDGSMQQPYDQQATLFFKHQRQGVPPVIMSSLYKA